MVFSRLTTTPLRRPSDGLSPTPRMVTGVPGSSDSAMTTATRDVPRSRPTVFFRRDKTVLERLLERVDVEGGLAEVYRLPACCGARFCGSVRGWVEALWWLPVPDRPSQSPPSDRAASRPGHLP